MCNKYVIGRVTADMGFYQPETDCIYHEQVIMAVSRYAHSFVIWHLSQVDKTYNYQPSRILWPIYYTCVWQLLLKDLNKTDWRLILKEGKHQTSWSDNIQCDMVVVSCFVTDIIFCHWWLFYNGSLQSLLCHPTLSHPMCNKTEHHIAMFHIQMSCPCGYNHLTETSTCRLLRTLVSLRKSS